MIAKQQNSSCSLQDIIPREKPAQLPKKHKSHVILKCNIFKPLTFLNLWCSIK